MAKEKTRFIIAYLTYFQELSKELAYFVLGFTSFFFPPFFFRIHFHVKDTLVCFSQNSILCCDITNDELPNINGMLSTASFIRACLDSVQSRAVSILVMGLLNGMYGHSVYQLGKRDGERASAHSFLSHIHYRELVIWSQPNDEEGDKT